jgi:hypothetical protein
VNAKSTIFFLYKIFTSGLKLSEICFSTADIILIPIDTVAENFCNCLNPELVIWQCKVKKIQACNCDIKLTVIGI